MGISKYEGQNSGVAPIGCFTHLTFAANNAGTRLVRPNENTGRALPYFAAGVTQLWGMGISTNADVTAGSVTLTAYINGSSQAGWSVVLNTTNPRHNRLYMNTPIIMATSDRLDVYYTSSADYTSSASQSGEVTFLGRLLF